MFFFKKVLKKEDPESTNEIEIIKAVTMVDSSTRWRVKFPLKKDVSEQLIYTPSQ